MISLDEEINKAIKEGFSEANAAAKVCQDVILDAISRSQFNRNNDLSQTRSKSLLN